MEGEATQGAGGGTPEGGKPDIMVHMHAHVYPHRDGGNRCELMEGGRY
eukprot:CAMPEP_0181227468 /NCGR_PEP_ID=MMETSP1096-20121128/32805_1 /TAXON_ID=156174 ORGANISM="Chrysochromulina ericina, Strain CCMP281" /NCGR_SAMPLE_ID=MMETSP1096 /ASSEMBLY_ACC=CAM_ASM_000453 /LENGTH=47 /DNA_ID= /DNA_START= /DNA_END= /DNA_ORIENTATION=